MIMIGIFISWTSWHR